MEFSIITDEIKENILYFDFLNYKLTQIDLDKAAEYTSKRNEKHYVNRRNALPEKVKSDIKYGKHGEIISSNGLKIIYPWVAPEVFEPDFKIYDDPRQKDYLPDLAGYVHVKTTTIRWLGGFYSWTFQLKNEDGNGGTDRIFKMSDKELSKEWGMFVVLYGDCTRGEVMFMIRMDIVKKLLRDPVKPEYKNIKLGLYSNDIFKLLEL